ncbi:MAG: sulfurtransferase TusA family protein [Candidatus Omnitrophota bacterium]|nr:sulfurtransferase TusA family protein [Candidatus Omnitrophota bacterium]
MFKLPDKVIKDIKDYKGSLDEFVKGKISYARFTGARVPWGIYSHRGGKIFMSRIRIPVGLAASKHLRAIAHVARAYGNGMAHITTRQDIQIHGVKIEDTIKVIEYLKDYDLSPRGGGGNTIRNITACPLAGICKDEVFDVRNYAVSLSEYLLNQETSYNLPRKFKIAFSGCGRDCAGCLVNDIGVLASEKDGKRGFRVYVGGGMGAEPKIGRLLEDFIPEEDLGYAVSAVKNVFYKNGDRRNKHHNRMRFLIEDIGFDKFKKLYDVEWKFLRQTECISLRRTELSYPESAGRILPDSEDKEFKDFLRYSFYPQKQEGLVSVELRMPRGDITAERLERLADLEKEFAGIEFRTSQNQNIFICNIREADIYKIFLNLKGILDDFLYPSTLLDMVCCKGALTCNLGLCNSPGLSEEVEKMIKERFVGTIAFGKLGIKINGCPNACGHHPLGLIAFHGIVRRVSGRPVPFYRLLLGGRKALEKTRLAKDTGILLPAKNVPLFLKDFIGAINRELSENTDIYDYIEERGETLARESAAPYYGVPDYLEDRNFYIDWGRTEEFSLEGLGPGECGRGVLDMIDADLSDAKISLEKAQRNDYSIQEIKRALFFSARALLVVRGLDPKDEQKALTGFIEKFIKEGIAPLRFSDLKDVYESLDERLDIKAREKGFLYAKEFFKIVTDLYNKMDSSLNFPKLGQKTVPEDTKKENYLLDLKGTPCPINYVKAKLFLENLEVGDITDILLDEGDPIRNVPKSLEGDGQQIIKIEKQDGFYKVTVKKNN